MKKQSRSSRNATHMNKRTKGRKGKSNKMMSLASRRSIIREKKQRRKIKINTGAKNSLENEDDDDIEILGEIFVGDHITKTHVENDDINNKEEDDDIVVLGEEKVHDPRILFKRKAGRKRKFNDLKNPKISNDIFGSSSFLEEEDDDIVELGKQKVDDARMILKHKRKPRIKRNAESEERNYETHASEDCSESIRQEDDSTNSSDTMNDNSSDDDFDIEKYNSSSVDSFGTVARESTDEDCYTPDDFVVQKRRRKKTTDETASYQALKKNSSKKIDENEKSTKRPNDSTCLISTEVSKNGSKDESSDRNELKKMETFVESSQQEKGLFIAQEASDEVSVVIFEKDKDENLKICSNDFEESKCMEEEFSEKGSDLLKFTPPIQSLHIKEDHKGKRVNLSDHEEQEVTDMDRQKSSPTAPVTCARCTKIFKERDTITDTKVSEKKVPVGKDEANEPNHANKTTTKKPNEGVQIEEFTPKRQKLQSSASLDEGKNLSAKQSDEKEFSKEEENVGFTKKEKVYKKNDFFKVLASRILREEDVDEEGEDVIREETSQEHSQPSSPYSLPLKFRFEEKETEVQDKSEYEIMVAGLFTELETHWTYDNMNASTICKDQYEIAKVSRHESSEINSCGEGKHDLVRNQEIGDTCRRCHQVVSEIRDILPDFTKNPTRCSKKRFVEKENFRVPEDLEVSTTMENLNESCTRSVGTIWNIIPGVKESMYKHQQDGFEFLWKNLVGTIDIAEMKNTNTKNVGGCIISHAPGTGKTRLSIVFVQSYLSLFPDSRPVIIAPASMLLTWEDEFKKWEVEFPFHNICNPEFSGKESKDLLKLFTKNRCQDNNKLVRWVKIFTWKKEKSILGISYNLYEKLAGEKVAADEESETLKRILLQLPGLVVLDEGHIPRNQSSSIWKTLLKLQTEKRIILSGTPFQNNFDELFNTLRLVRSGILEKEKTFAGMVSSKCRYSRKQQADKACSIEHSRAKEVDEGIEKLKCIMQPFVHVHKGSILQKKLPGLTDCVILLDPKSLQKSLIEKLEYSEKILELGYKVTLLSVHPSLAEHCWSSEYENCEINKDKLKELRLDYKAGTKTKFIMALIQLSIAMNEKVLIFSQYIYPLELIMDQIKANFDWHEGKEVLQMQGKQDQVQRQRNINIFNNPNSEAKVLLAATKCCSEGISLVGASRVVLLDVVWNPSVERQAISRAYRLGQEKVVYTYHLITSGTNEGDKYSRQAEKDRLSELVFSSEPKEKDELRVPSPTFEDMILQKMVSHDDLKDMFLKIISKPKEANLVETFSLVSPT